MVLACRAPKLATRELKNDDRPSGIDSSARKFMEMAWMSIACAHQESR